MKGSPSPREGGGGNGRGGGTPGSQSKFMRMGLAGASVTQECRQSRSGKERKENEAHRETRTDSVQKVCGGI